MLGDAVLYVGSVALAGRRLRDSAGHGQRPARRLRSHAGLLCGPVQRRPRQLITGSTHSRVGEIPARGFDPFTLLRNTTMTKKEYNQLLGKLDNLDTDIDTIDDAIDKNTPPNARKSADMDLTLAVNDVREALSKLTHLVVDSQSRLIP